MWIEGKWFEECQLPAYLKAEREKSYREGYTAAVAVTADNFAIELQVLREERDAYKRELVLWLGKIGECDVPLAFPAHLRLEELIGRPHVNICEGD